ncbi:hypothetical protein BCR35DRAFT_147010 [Leucosporidium creatinivorum]|uniref:SET domain-containing protein n=1 Tax=Leucosporidium creatinivorum TaxID=106004 RepID=A0A1Y2EPT2_9BASI|nr:hypothetical protein BCR35DRAFT_147010 [Leucosporidium creatinivorum]
MRSLKALICRIASKCARTIAVCFVVEDALGRLAPVQLHHFPACEHLNDQFALGLHFAIKEPNIRSSRDGFVIRIESPSDFVRLLPSSPLLANLTFPPPRRLPVIRLSPAQQKDEGNRSFAQRRFAAATDAYSLALDDKDVDDTLRIILLANRAAVLLKLNLFNAALADCTTALPLGPSPSLQLKILYRAATAAYARQQFVDASEHLTNLLQLSPDDLDAQDLYRRTQVRLVEAARGDYDWPFLFARATQVETLDVAEFVSDAFEVKEIAGRGRGIVARRRIEPGELLMVQKPLAMGVPDPKRKSFVVGANLFTETMDPYAVGDLVALLAERIGDDERTRRRVLALHAGDESILVPIGDSTSPGIDISRLEAIATFNAFHTESLAQKSKTLSPSEEAAQNIHAPSSLYDLPSMLNHSCIGNVSYSFLADVFFLRVRLTIQPGDELVDSYVDSLEGLAQRSEKLDKHRFVCQCQLCDYDREDGERAGKERERLASQLEELTDRIHGVQEQDPAPLLPTIRAFIDKIQATYKPSRPNLRPALYSALRLLGATLGTLGKFEEAIQVELRALVALGAEFEGEREAARLVEVPKLGDLNGVLSCLFIASQYQKLQKSDAVRNWIAIARRIERGQAGEAGFEVRYAEWAQKNRLTLRLDEA